MDEVILSRITKEAYEHGYADGKVDGYNLASKAISSQRKKGKWVKKTDAVCYWYECSVCGEKSPLSIHRQEWHSWYCPNCGAEMTGGDEPCTT